MAARLHIKAFGESKLNRFRNHPTLLRLADGRQVCVDYSPPGGESSKWLVYLPGSAAALTSIAGPGLPGLLRSYPAHLLVINKVGVQPDGRVQKALFEDSFLREQRICDVVDVIRQIIPEEHQICLIGYSEGAYLAPEIALRCKQIQALLLLAGGTRGWLEEELNKMTASEFRREQHHVSAIYAGLSPNRRWRGFSHRTWNSFETSQTLKALERLQIPILSIYGSRDTVIDQRSMCLDLRRLRHLEFFNVRRLNNLDHQFHDQWDRVLRASRPLLASFL